MPYFRLTFPSAQNGASGAMTFEADDAAAALSLAQRHGNGRPAELWHGDRRICRIAADEGGFWQIG
jgi:hypothetical protein